MQLSTAETPVLPLMASVWDQISRTDRRLCTTVTQATSCLVTGLVSANWTERGLGPSPSAIVSNSSEYTYTEH